MLVKKNVKLNGILEFYFNNLRQKNIIALINFHLNLYDLPKTKQGSASNYFNQFSKKESTA